MRVLLICGLGPAIKNQDLLTGSLFDPCGPQSLDQRWDLSRLHVVHGRHRYPLLRPYDPLRSASLPFPVPGTRARQFPHLTTLTLESILQRCGLDVVSYQAERLWAGADDAPAEAFGVVLLSTTFIWERRSLTRAIRWVQDRYPGAVLVLGGQYSNLKYREILTAHPFVRFIVRGDAEVALPALLGALVGRGEVDQVPNLTWRDPDTGVLRATRIRYADLEAEPSPTATGHAPVVPYESMRGCPFSCKFCSFPAASPQWRYKSAAKIADDFGRYRDENGTTFVKALDSTFTVPRHRLRELLPLLARVGVAWEAYTRANAINDPRIVDALAAAHCASLAIGFESMSDTVLGFMNKKVTAAANRRALQLLCGSGIDYRASFMVGYPGETPDHFAETRRFLLEEYTGRFSLYVFSLADETMPVWADADRSGLRVLDEEAPDEAWEHTGMNHLTARDLQRQTLKDIRWGNDRAVLNLWQGAYEMPLAPTLPEQDNLRIEKLVERLGMLPVDVPNPAERARQYTDLLDSLRKLHVQVLQPHSMNT